MMEAKGLLLAVEVVVVLSFLLLLLSVSVDLLGPIGTDAKGLLFDVDDDVVDVVEGTAKGFVLELDDDVVMLISSGLLLPPKLAKELEAEVDDDDDDDEAPNEANALMLLFVVVVVDCLAESADAVEAPKPAKDVFSGTTRFFSLGESFKPAGFSRSRRTGTLATGTVVVVVVVEVRCCSLTISCVETFVDLYEADLLFSARRSAADVNRGFHVGITPFALTYCC